MSNDDRPLQRLLCGYATVKMLPICLNGHWTWRPPLCGGSPRWFLFWPWFSSLPADLKLNGTKKIVAFNCISNKSDQDLSLNMTTKCQQQSLLIELHLQQYVGQELKRTSSLHRPQYARSIVNRAYCSVVEWEIQRKKRCKIIRV